VSGVADAGLTMVGVRELSVHHGETRRRLAADLLGLRLVLTVAALAVAVAFTAVAGYGGLMVAGVALAGLGAILQGSQAALGVSLQSRLRLGWLTAAELLRQVVTVALIVGLIVAGAGLLAFLAVPIPAGVAILVVTALLVRGDIPLRPAFQTARWKALMRDVFPYAVAVALGVVYLRAAIILVSLIAGDTETGYFGLSYRVVDVLVAVPGLVLSAAFPIFARAAADDRSRLAYALGRTFEATLVLGVGVTLVIALGAPVAIDVIGGEEFEPAIPVLRIQGAAIGAMFVGTVWGHALLSLRLYRTILWMSLGILLAGGGVIAALTVADGARGAAIGTVVAEVGLAVGGLIVLAHHDRSLVPSLRPVPRVLAAGGLAACLALVPGLPVVVLTLAAGAVFLALVWALGALPPELVHAIRRRPEA
jgi:O-antigen/teichoic acid export membrane protein